MTTVDSIRTLLLCNQTLYDRLPLELLRLILISTGTRPPTSIEELDLLLEVNEDDCYRFDIVQCLPTGVLPDIRKCIQHSAINCLQHFFAVGGAKILSIYGEYYHMAVKVGNLDILQCLYDNDTPKDHTTLIYAAKVGHIHVLDWLHAHNFRRSWMSCAWAARVCSIDVLKWLIDHEYEKSNDVCTHAAEMGRLDVLKWLVANGFTKSREACCQAFMNGHLEVLRWLVDEQFPDAELYHDCLTIDFQMSEVIVT